MAAVLGWNPFPWEARKSRRIIRILRLFIGDIPGRASIDDDAINDA
jgi:hypothetical protein